MLGGGGDGGWGPAKGSGGRSGPYDNDGASYGGSGGGGGGPPMANNPLTGPPAPLNEDGLPVRPDKESCLYYLNTGSCKSGTQCIFNHPPKTAREQELKKSLSKVGMPEAPAGMDFPSSDDNVGPSNNMGGGLSAGMQGMLEKLEALQSGGKAPPDNTGAIELAIKNNNGASEQKPAPAPGMPMPFQSTTAWVEPKDNTPVEYNDEGLPIRPGMQKCGYYLKSGKCTYGPGCRFDHPAGLGGLMSGGGAIGFGNFPGMVGGPMTEGAMAMRPGRDQCPFLKRTGACPFGPECRFDHSGNTTEPSPATSPVVGTPKADPLSRKKEKGLGGTRGRRPPPAGQNKR